MSNSTLDSLEQRLLDKSKELVKAEQRKQVAIILGALSVLGVNSYVSIKEVLKQIPQSDPSIYATIDGLVNFGHENLRKKIHSEQVSNFLDEVDRLKKQVAELQSSVENLSNE